MQDIEPKVTIIIVNYNGRPLLERHLPSVMQTDYSNFSVLVVDNGSTDDSVAFLKKRYPAVQVIKNHTNLGFARANNIGFQTARESDYFAILNSDMDVEPDWLEKLVETAESDSKIAAVGPKILYAKKIDGKSIINSAGGVVDSHSWGFDRFEGQEDSEKYSVVEDVDFVSGGAALLRREAVEQVGGFDDRMFFYYEDVDLCQRMKDMNWKIMYNGKAVVYHDHMGTSGTWSSFRRTKESNMNRIRSIKRRKGLAAAALEFIISPIQWFAVRLSAPITKVPFSQWLFSRARREGLTF